MMRRFQLSAIANLVLMLCIGCASAPTPNTVVVPDARMDNGGKYYCPYTQDEVLAEWTDMAAKAKGGAAVGSAVGAEVGKRVLGHIPIIGGLLGSKAGEAAGRAIAVKKSGGWDFIQKTSDISFDELRDMAVFMYANYSAREYYKNALDATQAIYPKMKKKYFKWIKKAHKAWKKQQKNAAKNG